MIHTLISLRRVAVQSTLLYGSCREGGRWLSQLAHQPPVPRTQGAPRLRTWNAVNGCNAVDGVLGAQLCLSKGVQLSPQSRER